MASACWEERSLNFSAPSLTLPDASISVGVITLLVFQKRFFKRYRNTPVHSTVETNTEVSDKGAGFLDFQAFPVQLFTSEVSIKMVFCIYPKVSK
jgi:hypothetical protein